MCRQGSESGLCWPLLNASKQTEQVVKSLLSTSMALLILLLLAISNLFETQSFLDIITSITVPLPKPQTMSHMEIRLLSICVSLFVVILTGRWRCKGGDFQILYF